MKKFKIFYIPESNYEYSFDTYEEAKKVLDEALKCLSDHVLEEFEIIEIDVE